MVGEEGEWRGQGGGGGEWERGRGHSEGGYTKRRQSSKAISGEAVIIIIIIHVYFGQHSPYKNIQDKKQEQVEK